VDSIKEKLLVLPGETLVLPGHGEPTTLEKEKGEITEFLARPRNPNLHGDVLWKSA
jgi:glyoxylase-like metal-dependent hydrolase (beta-lactamase superfamily II)